MITRVLSVLLFSVLSFYSKANDVLPPPLTDGHCTEYEVLNAEIIQLSKDVNLNIYQDQHYVWFCYSYPEKSFGTLDLEIESANLDARRNLHVSAQNGEWPFGQTDKEPKTPESELWWETEGWIANNVWINGMDKTKEPYRYHFKNAPAREIQLSKKRFGRGEWKLRFNIRSIQPLEGERYNIRFPQEKDFVLKVN